MKSFDAPFRKPEAKETQVGGSHYKDMPIQPWDALEAWMTLDEIRGYHKGVAISYLAREHRKAGMKISQRQSTIYRIDGSSSCLKIQHATSVATKVTSPKQVNGVRSQAATSVMTNTQKKNCPFYMEKPNDKENHLPRM
jgi:hypothetical protein